MLNNMNLLYRSNERGFTLIELSMVLVLIGVILGMVFKGKGLIDQAKTKSVQSQLYKIQMAVETFRQQYGYWPADGCVHENDQQCTAEKDGVLDSPSEQQAFWSVLIRQHLLSEQDKVNAFGKSWRLTFEGGEHDVAGHFLATTLPLSHICLLDRQMDDGVANTGILQTNNQAYDAKTSCDGLSKQDAVLHFLLS